MGQSLETAKRMMVDMPNMWKDMQVGQSPIFTEDALAAVVEAGNVIVISNWVPNEFAKRVSDKNEVLRMPHRLVFLTLPLTDDAPHNLPEGVKPCYYLVDLVLADAEAIPAKHETWKGTEKHQLYIVGIKDSSSELARKLTQVLTSWKGRYKGGHMHNIFEVEADGTLCFRGDFNYPPFARPVDQKSFDIEASEGGNEVRLIKIGDEETEEVARKIVELNSVKPEPLSKLF